MFIFGKNTVRWSIIGLLMVIVCWMAGCGSEKVYQAPSIVSPEQAGELNKLNETADELYRFAMDNNVGKARDKLEELAVKMTQVRFEGVTTVEGVGALSDAIVKAKRVFQSVGYTPAEGQASTAQIRLATDALTHTNKPMWLQYYKSMKESSDQLSLYWRAQNSKPALAALEQLEQRYNTIRPSILISRQPSEVEKFDSLFSFLRTELTKPEVNWTKLAGALQQLQPTMDELFTQGESAFVPFIEQPSPMRLILTLGSTIIAVLAFALWRIFKFEQRLPIFPKK